jgi:hypothetical protein
MAGILSSLGAAGGGVLGGVLGGEKAIGAGKDAERYYDDLSNAWAQLGLPDLNPVEFEKYRDTYVPELMQGTEMSGIEIDPALKEGQMAALNQLAELSQGGLNLQDKADLAEIQGQVAQQDKARQDAIMMNMAERGMGGAGMELAQRLQSQSSGADRAAADARNVAAQAQQRALDAISRRGTFAGQMRDQQFGEDSQRARAQDAINQFNVGAKNQAGMMRQDTANANTDLMNQQMQQGNQIAQQQFNNEAAKMQGRSGLAAGRAGATQAIGDARAKRAGAIGSGIGQMFGAMGGK